MQFHRFPEKADDVFRSDSKLYAVQLICLTMKPKLLDICFQVNIKICFAYKELKRAFAVHL